MGRWAGVSLHPCVCVCVRVFANNIRIHAWHVPQELNEVKLLSYWTLLNFLPVVTYCTVSVSMYCATQFLYRLFVVVERNIRHIKFEKAYERFPGRNCKLKMS